MTLRNHFQGRTAGLYVGAGFLASVFSTQVQAEDFEFPASPYYCQKLDGSAVGERQCSAAYQPYPGDACGVYDSADEKDPALDEVIATTGSQCSSSQLDAAKAKTLEKRADMMGYVSLGHDETQNDPVRNTSLRPESATYWPAMTYFANECAIQKCGGGTPGESSNDSNDTNDYNTDPDPTQSYPSTDNTNECKYEDDGVCDVPSLCPSGTDVNDCRPKVVQKPKVESPYLTLNVCNQHEHQISVAFGSRRTTSDKFWKFSGWYNVNPYTCRTLGTVMKGYLYFHAMDAQGHKWGDEKRFCVRSKPFEYWRDGVGKCSERSELFSEVFTKKDNYTFTFNQ